MWADVLENNLAFKEEGQTCGACFTISGDCGKCKPGLECVPDENVIMLPDLPSRCRAPTKEHDEDCNPNFCTSPFAVAIAITMVILIMISMGIALYSCNWPYFIELICCYECIFDRLPENRTIESTTASNEIAIDLPPKYEEIELQTVFSPAHFLSFSFNEDQENPPKYSDIVVWQ